MGAEHFNPISHIQELHNNVPEHAGHDNTFTENTTTFKNKKSGNRNALRMMAAAGAAVMATVIFSHVQVSCKPSAVGQTSAAIAITVSSDMKGENPTEMVYTLVQTNTQEIIAEETIPFAAANLSFGSLTPNTTYRLVFTAVLGEKPVSIGSYTFTTTAPPVASSPPQPEPPQNTSSAAASSTASSLAQSSSIDESDSSISSISVPAVSSSTATVSSSSAPVSSSSSVSVSSDVSSSSSTPTGGTVTANGTPAVEQNTDGLFATATFLTNGADIISGGSITADGVAVATLNAADIAVTDNGNGTYTASVAASIAGNLNPGIYTSLAVNVTYTDTNGASQTATQTTTMAYETARANAATLTDNVSSVLLNGSGIMYADGALHAMRPSHVNITLIDADGTQFTNSTPIAVILTSDTTFTFSYDFAGASAAKAPFTVMMETVYGFSPSGSDTQVTTYDFLAQCTLTGMGVN